MATTPVPPDFSEFLRLLNQLSVRYLLVGGYAVNAYGHSRRTDDLDVWVGSDVENAGRLRDALVAFGLTSGSVSPEMFMKPGAIVRVGHPPLRLEILNTIAGVQFERCYPRRTYFEIDGQRISVIGLSDLLRNKRAAGRHKDLADVEALSAPRRTRKKSPVRLAAKKRSKKCP